MSSSHPPPFSPPPSTPVCNADYPCEGMSRHATFENFGMAFLTLFQVSTGDNWNGIMKVGSAPGPLNTDETGILLAQQ